MDIVRIFETEDCDIGAIIYDGDNIDIFTKLIRQWKDVEYITTYLIENETDLLLNMQLTIDEALKQIREELQDFIDEMIAIQDKEPGYEEATFYDVFEHYHEKEFILRK